MTLVVAEGRPATVARTPRGVGPWAGFALAAEAAVRDLQSRFGGDLWTVTRTDGDRCVVVAAAGPRVGRGEILPGEQVGTDQGGDTPRVQVPFLRHDGERIGSVSGWWAGSGRTAVLPARAAAALLARMLSTIAAAEWTAAERSAEAADAYALANRDALTGLLNRRGWQAAVGVEEQRARRYGRAVSVVVVDLDGLKRINDTEGHHAGDAALSACAGVLTAVCRPGDAVARMGGDEFAVMAVECDVVSARALALRLRVSLRTAGVAASVGFATRRPGEDLGDTVHRADRAMYHAKRPRRGPAGTRRGGFAGA